MYAPRILAAVPFLASLTMALPSLDSSRYQLQSRAPTRYVFAHFMVGIVSNRGGPGDWDADMKRAKAYGIDAFALNIGTDSFTDQQLDYAYTSAANNNMKVFLSFDFAWWSTSNPSAVGAKIAVYAGRTSQLMVDNKVFVSTFVGDGVDVAAVRSAAGRPIYFAPNFNPNITPNFSNLDSAFNWMGWPNNGQNRAPNPGQTGTVEAGDQKYISALNGKDYLAPVSPWFFTHYGAEVSYSKNWLFPGDTLWFDRWSQLLQMGPRFIEIVSWNDFGESHYVGPLSSTHYDDGASKWVNDMPHDGWLEMAKPYIAAYKASATSVNSYIASDQLIYWYRPQLKSSNCDSTDTCVDGRPNGYGTVADQTFIVALLKTAGTVRVRSGNMGTDFSAPAGASIFKMPMAAGIQRFTLIRGSTTVYDSTSLKNIIDGCVCGLYNYNAYVGVVPSTGTPPSLDTNGLSRFSNGLKVSCSAKPSLGSTTTTTATATTTPKVSTSSVSTPTSMSVVTSTLTLTSGMSTRTVTTSSASSTPASLVCVSGSGQGNYGGLCSFACYYGYCPIGPCTCLSYGTQNPLPAWTGVNGVPADGLDGSYSGLCSFCCGRGYCPSGACKAA